MFNNIFKKGFRTPPKPSKKQLALQAQLKEFLADYEVVCRKHKLQMVPVIKNLPHGGFEPDFKLMPYEPVEPPKLKGWGEAEEENLKVRKICRHLNENGENCKHCGVRLADQDPSGTGVTESYVLAKEEKIKAWKEKAKEHDAPKGEAAAVL